MTALLSRLISMRARLAIGACLLLVALLASASLFGDLPSPDALAERASPGTTKILDRHGRLLYEILDPRDGRRTRIALSDLPPHLIQAVLSVEDANFYSHPGVDVAGIARAGLLALRSGQAYSGGSTITQQLARDVLMSPEERQSRTLVRKAREMVLAVRLTAAYGRDDILAMYLNQVYFGQLAYGIEAAARTYFGKPADQLDLAESALLAGLIQAPAAYDPLVYFDAARDRQRVVLGLMEKQGYVSGDEAQLALAETLHFAAQTPAGTLQAPHFVAYIRGLLEQQFGSETVNTGGLVVTTTLDLDLQQAAETAVTRQLEALRREARESGGPDHNVSNAALVALDPRSGQILAMVGSADYFDAGIDGAVNVALALRQPGSAIKPVTYAAAFASGLTPATVVNDLPKTFITREGLPYSPENYDRIWHGPIALRDALATSNNMAAVRVLDSIGLPAFLQAARDLGITSFGEADRFGLSLTLGGGEVTLLELTGAYGAFANAGRPAAPIAVLDVSSRSIPELAWSSAQPSLVGVSPQVAYLLTDILADDLARMPAFGAGSALSLSRPAAAKTGTTTDFRDNWTIGYTPNLAAGVWVGNADGRPMVRSSGVTGAAPIWHDFMEAAMADRPVTDFTRPDGLVDLAICATSGLLATSDCPRRRTETFIAGTEPLTADDSYRRIQVDPSSGLLWSAGCSGVPVQRVFRVLDEEAAEWGRSAGIPELPAAYCDGRPAQRTASTSSVLAQAELPLTIQYPDNGAVLALSRQIPAGLQMVALEARAAPGISGVAFTLDGIQLAAVAAPPYRFLWPLAAGDHVLSVSGTDATGATVAARPINFTVIAAETAGRP